MSERETADSEWRRLLKGGFAFQDAPFASHPADARRAERMVFVARIAGANNDEITACASSYLQSQGVNGRELKEQLERVRAFISRFRIKRRASNMWLVFWNSMDEPVDDATSRLIACFDPRSSGDRVMRFVEDYYLAVEYSNSDKIYFSTRKSQNPYRARINNNFELKRQSITCGHNPWVEARFCRNVVVWQAGDTEEVRWEEKRTIRNPEA